MAFKEMSFEWEFLHPKGSETVGQELELNCFSSQPPDDESVGEEIFQEEIQLSDENLEMDEVAAVEEEIAFEEDEDDSNFYLRSISFEEVGKFVECCDPEIEVKDGCEAFRLKKWLKSSLMAAATLSIFMLGRGRSPLMAKNQRIQFSVSKKEEVKDFSVQHQKADSPSFSLSAYYDERF